MGLRDVFAGFGDGAKAGVDFLGGIYTFFGGRKSMASQGWDAKVIGPGRMVYRLGKAMGFFGGVASNVLLTIHLVPVPGILAFAYGKLRYGHLPRSA